MSEHQVRVEESRRESTRGYREDGGPPDLQLTRPALEPGVDPLAMDARWVLSSVAVAALGVLITVISAYSAGSLWSEGDPNAYWVGPPVLAGLLMLCPLVLLVHSRIARARERALHDVDQTREVRVVDGQIEASREGEWSEVARLADVDEVEVVEGKRFHRIRVRLADGERTDLLDGIEHLDEAESVATRLRERLARG